MELSTHKEAWMPATSRETSDNLFRDARRNVHDAAKKLLVALEQNGYTGVAVTYELKIEGMTQPNGDKHPSHPIDHAMSETLGRTRS